MSYTDDEIDKLFKEAGLNQKTPVFQDSFFDEVEALLPQKRNKKGIIWIFGSFLALIVGIGTFVGFNYSKIQISKSNSISKTNVKTKEIASNLNTSTNASTLNNSIVYSKPNSSKAKSFALKGKNDIQKSKNNRTFNNKKHIAENKFNESELNLNPIAETTRLTEIENSLLPVIKLNNENKNESEFEFSLENLTPHDFSLDQNLGDLMANPFLSKSSRYNLTVTLASGFSENFITNVPAIGSPVFVNSLGADLSYKIRSYKLSAGLNYSNYQTHDLNLNRSSKVYGFEVAKYNQTIDYKWISTLQLPISIEKEFGNHSLSFGIDPSLVLGSCVNFTKYENDLVLDDSRYYANMIGLKRFYLGAHISYDLKLLKDYSFGIKISNQLINPMDMSKFEGSSNKNPFQAQITIKKHFKLK